MALFDALQHVPFVTYVGIPIASTIIAMALYGFVGKEYVPLKVTVGTHFLGVMLLYSLIIGSLQMQRLESYRAAYGPDGPQPPRTPLWVIIAVVIFMSAGLPLVINTIATRYVAYQPLYVLGQMTITLLLVAAWCQLMALYGFANAAIWRALMFGAGGAAILSFGIGIVWLALRRQQLAHWKPPAER